MDYTKAALVSGYATESRCPGTTAPAAASELLLFGLLADVNIGRMARDRPRKLRNIEKAIVGRFPDWRSDFLHLQRQGPRDPDSKEPKRFRVCRAIYGDCSSSRYHSPGFLPKGNITCSTYAVRWHSRRYQVSTHSNPGRSISSCM